jgi:hydrogenase maturation protease
MSCEVLVAGIGNIFLSDDAFGVEVVKRLAGRSIPSAVRVEDFGIRGMHLAYELLEGYRVLILIDAVAMGEPAGTLAVLEPELDHAGSADDEANPVVDAHTMNPDVVLGTLARLGGSLDKVLIVGCQPANLQEGMGLSATVESVVDEAVEMCLQLVSEIVQPAGKGT